MKRSGYLKRPDCSIFYEVSGSGPALIFAHGVGGNHLSWWQQVAHFAARYTCVMFSHRGFTPSSTVPGATAPDAFADDLAALVEELKLPEVRLVAQSMGGWTCLEYALRAKIFQLRTQSPEVLAQLPVPVLFLAGDEDHVYPCAAGPALAALAPKGRAARVPDTGHSVYFERPAEFNRMVDEFFQTT